MRMPRTSWQRELPPIIAVAGLAADYLSPPALWTMLLPFGCVVLLLAMRKWVHAAAVFLLCSWVLDEAVEDLRVPGAVRFRLLPIGPGHLINPHWVLADVIATFADYHNELVIDRALGEASDHLDE